MRKALLFLAAFMVIAAVSCKKDEKTDGGSNVAEGKMTTTVDGKSTTFTIYANTQTTTSGGTQIQVVSIIGTTASASNTTNFSSFIVYVAASTVTAKTYSVPSTSNYQINYTDGFAYGMYYANASDYSNYYYAFGVDNASGTVTIASITDTNVKGSYDMTLVNSTDNTKTKKLVGQFNAKFGVPGY
jgi:hypothetical protein